MWRLPKNTCVSHMFLLSMCCLSVASFDVRDPFNLLPASPHTCLADKSDISIDVTHE